MGRSRSELDTTRYSHRLAESIKLRREKAGLDPEGLAKLVGVSRGTIFAWESGRRRPDLDDLPRIAQSLGVKLQTLLPKE